MADGERMEQKTRDYCCRKTKTQTREEEEGEEGGEKDRFETRNEKNDIV